VLTVNRFTWASIHFNYSSPIICKSLAEELLEAEVVGNGNDMPRQDEGSIAGTSSVGNTPRRRDLCLVTVPPSIRCRSYEPCGKTSSLNSADSDDLMLFKTVALLGRAVKSLHDDRSLVADDASTCNFSGLYCALTTVLRVYLPTALSRDEIDTLSVPHFTKTRDEKMTTTSGATKAIPELQADVLQYSEEIARLEEKLLQGLSPTERLETEIRLRQLERALLSATMNLSVATTKSEFSADVQRLDGKVATLSSRQDTVEQRQEDIESLFEEEKRSKNNELQDLKNKFDLLIEENRTRKAEEARLWSAVDEVRTEQRKTRRTVDVIDNRQRKQNLILHGLKPNTAKEELLSLLPEDIGALIDNVWPVTKVGADGSVSMAVQFSKVSACEQACEFIVSREFKTRNGGRIRCAQDESELTRVGGSRLRAISEHLRAKFGDEIGVKRLRPVWRCEVSCSRVREKRHHDWNSYG
jgi:hypothetical protein